MDYEALNKIVDESGLTRQFIANRLNMGSKTFSDRMRGITLFKVDEARDLSKILRMSRAQRDHIFFS